MAPAMTMATAAFLRVRNGIGWPGRGLVTLTVVFVLVVLLNWGCGIYRASLLVAFTLPAVALFALGVRRAVVGAT